MGFSSNTSGEVKADKLLAERAYDVNKLIHLIHKQKIEAVIPPTAKRKIQRDCIIHSVSALPLGLL